MGIVAARIEGRMQGDSAIRKMFERGRALKRQFGVGGVHDFSLGNPNLGPPLTVLQRLHNLAAFPTPGMHRYMPNAGFLDVRQRVAAFVNTRQNLRQVLSAEHILMTVGATGAINVVLNAILNPGDEVVVPSPYFSEYGFYVDNHGGTLVPVDTLKNFQLDVAALNTAITPRTKAILLNNPNNPTGVVYSEGALRQLAACIQKKETNFSHPILVIADEPYARIVYDRITVPLILTLFPNSVLVNSHSKDLGLAGERIGYAAVSPRFPDGQKLMDAMIFTNRTLGFVSAPALMQRLVAEVQGELVGLAEYQARRNLLFTALRRMGYSLVRPQGAFYLFPQSPIPDDVAFCEEAAQEHRLLVVPGTSFGKPGHFRIAFAGTPSNVIEKALPAFWALAKKYDLAAAERQSTRFS